MPQAGAWAVGWSTTDRVRCFVWEQLNETFNETGETIWRIRTDRRAREFETALSRPVLISNYDPRTCPSPATHHGDTFSRSHKLLPNHSTKKRTSESNIT